MKERLIRITDLVHEFPNGQRGINGVSLDIYRGEFIVLAGPNGSGKTVLMRHLNALIRPSSGKLTLEGESIADNPHRARRRVGLVFQDADNQIVGQTVWRDVAFGPENLKLKRQEISQRVQQALKATGLVGFDQRRPHSLSGGEKRRLATAGVLAMQPDILVLDEPFIGLDWPGCADLIEILLQLHSRATTILLITHDLEKVLAHADRLVLMKEGRIYGDDHPEKLLSEVEKLGIRRPHGDLASMTWRRP